MKRKAKVAILGMLLQGGAHAAAQSAPAAAPTLDKAPTQAELVQQAVVSGKKSKTARNKKAAPQPEKGKPEPAKQDAATETPAESSEQGVQLRGVRG